MGLAGPGHRQYRLWYTDRANGSTMKRVILLSVLRTWGGALRDALEGGVIEALSSHIPSRAPVIGSNFFLSVVDTFFLKTKKLFQMSAIVVSLGLLLGGADKRIRFVIEHQIAHGLFYTLVECAPLRLCMLLLLHSFAFTPFRRFPPKNPFSVVKRCLPEGARSGDSMPQSSALSVIATLFERPNPFVIMLTLHYLEPISFHKLTMDLGRGFATQISSATNGFAIKLIIGWCAPRCRASPPLKPARLPCQRDGSRSWLKARLLFGPLGVYYREESPVSIEYVCGELVDQDDMKKRDRVDRLNIKSDRSVEPSASWGLRIYKKMVQTTEDGSPDGILLPAQPIPRTERPQTFTFSPNKEFSGGKRFSNDERVKEAVEKWFLEEEWSVFDEGIKMLEPGNCMEVDGDCVKK
ncbi:hypothetical protein AAG570_010031 [Ranatra chinensis]|uniref:Uncharacterized protein n=1 Tax=Ranatra chinensis TaxID=642074 RepID=A0ABD0Z3I6_9HEMI